VDEGARRRSDRGPLIAGLLGILVSAVAVVVGVLLPVAGDDQAQGRPTASAPPTPATSVPTATVPTTPAPSEAVPSTGPPSDTAVPSEAGPPTTDGQRVDAGGVTRLEITVAPPPQTGSASGVDRFLNLIGPLGTLLVGVAAVAALRRNEPAAVSGPGRAAADEPAPRPPPPNGEPAS
jgi:hypothetical protein